jgi:hypothetical protein
VQDFFAFINAEKDIDDKKIEEIRREYEISLRKNQATVTDANAESQQYSILEAGKCKWRMKMLKIPLLI